MLSSIAIKKIEEALANQPAKKLDSTVALNASSVTYRQRLENFLEENKTDLEANGDKDNVVEACLLPALECRFPTFEEFKEDVLKTSAEGAVLLKFMGPDRFDAVMSDAYKGLFEEQ
jgi:hypothetical protein